MSATTNDTLGRLVQATADDGTTAEAREEGAGTPLLVIHGGMGDPEAWKKVTDRLKDRYRTVRLHRRQYRMDLPRKISMADEVQHVAAIATLLGKPVLVAHSSGAVLALEALVANPGAYAGAALYEPPVPIGEPLGGVHGEKSARARRALDAGHPGKALTIFLREIVRMGPVPARIAGFLVGHSRYQERVVRQLDDNDAIDEVGTRLTAYRKIGVPVLLIGGNRSPKHLMERLDALEEALPDVSRVVLEGQGHGANVRAPGPLAEVIAERFRPQTTS